MGYNEFYYQYDAGQAALAGLSGFFMVFFILLYLLLAGIGVLSYVLQSLGIHTMAKRRGIHHPWLSWLPLGHVWILGSISDQYQYLVKGRVTNRRKVLLGLEIAMYGVLAAIFAIAASLTYCSVVGDMAAMGALVALFALAYIAFAVLIVVTLVFIYIALYDLYVSSSPDNAVMYLLLSIFISITMPFFVFASRNKDGGMPPRKVAEPVLPELPAEEIPEQKEPEQETEE